MTPPPYKIIIALFVTLFLLSATNPLKCCCHIQEQKLCNKLEGIIDVKQSLAPSSRVSHNVNNLGPISNIDHFCRESINYSDTAVTFLGGSHTLNTTCEFRNVKNFTLGGENDSKVTIHCSQEDHSGFRFLNVSTVELSGIELIGCGFAWNITYKDFDGLTSEVLSALVIINGSNVTLRNVTVMNAKSVGIYVYNVAGNVVIDSCEVVNALSDKKNTMSGNVIAYDNHTTASTNLYIVRSQFANSGYTNITGGCSLFKTTSYSCGLALFFGSSKLTAVISKTKLYGNSGCNGGNMALLIFDYSRNSQIPMITIDSTSFTNGSAYIGGGLYVSFEDSFSDYEVERSDSLHQDFLRVLSVTNSVFRNNYAERIGGGIYIQWKQSPVLTCVLDVYINGSTFDSNSLGTKGSGGLALTYNVYIEAGNLLHVLPKHRVNLIVSKSCFHNHNPNIFSEQLLSESSVILAKMAPYFGVDDVTITSNNCTALLAIGTNIVFYGSSNISHNTALTGAGVRLCSSSVIYFSPHTHLVITDNSAHITGGGISVESNCLVNVPMCFYQYTKQAVMNDSLLETINITVKSNTACEGGNNIFGGSIDYCYFIRRTDEKFKRQLHVPNNTVSIPSSISSNPQHVCFYEVSDNKRLECGKSRTTTVYPGQEVTYPVRLVGQRIGSVPGMVTANSEGGVAIHPQDQVKTVSILGDNLTYTIYSLGQVVPPSGQARLKLTAYLNSDVSVHEYVHRYLPAVIHINYFKECPLGFIYSNQNIIDQNVNTTLFSCQCVEHHAIKYCTIQNQTIIKNKHFWIGIQTFENKSFLVTSFCPLDYCDPKITKIKSMQNYVEQDKQCRYNRTGILCGSCPEGWSLVLGSSECREKCSNVWLLLIFPFALAGLLLVAIIHYLNLTVTVGTINGLIFYANIIQDYSMSLLLEYPVPGLTPVLQVFLAWLNFDLGVTTCFYDNMGAFGKTILLSAFPIYIWLISAVIVALSHRYISVTRLLGNNSVKVLATLILLSYSKMLRVIVGCLSFKTLKFRVNEATTVYQTIWTLDGNIPYFNPRLHLSLFIFGILLILASFPFSISLLCIRHVYFLSNCHRAFSWINKLKPFFDTYTGPYKDNARFWTGLLLFVRLLMLLIHVCAFENSPTTTPNLFIVVFCFILLASIILLNGVYKKHSLNVLECFFIFNLGLIFVFHVGTNELWKGILAHILVSLSFLVFLGILAYHFHLKCSDYRWLHRVAFWRRNVEFDVRSFEGMRGYSAIDNSTEDEDNTGTMAEARDGMMCFPPLQNYHCNSYGSNKA